jgi:hypothetical protein
MPKVPRRIKLRRVFLEIIKYVLSREINFGRQCHFKIWLIVTNLKNFPA